MDLLAHPHHFVATGALAVAITTAAEVVTAPYSAHVVLYELNPAVHAVKVVAALVFVTGMLALGAKRRSRLGRVGSSATWAIAAGTTLGAIPYSVAEAMLRPSMSPTEAADLLDEAYETRLAWIGYAAPAAMLLILVGMITLAVVVLRRQLLPRWRPLLSLTAIPLAVLAGVISETTGLPVPHPPAWLFACLAIAYSAPLVLSPHPSARVGNQQSTSS